MNRRHDKADDSIGEHEVDSHSRLALTMAIHMTRVGAVVATERKYWSENSQYIDEPMVDTLFAVAADVLLKVDEGSEPGEESTKMARDFHEIAIRLQA